MQNNRWLWVLGFVFFVALIVFGEAIYDTHRRQKMLDFQNIKALEAEEKMPAYVYVTYTALHLHGAEIYINPMIDGILVPNFSKWRTILEGGQGGILLSVGEWRKIAREGFEFGIIFPKDHTRQIFPVVPSDLKNQRGVHGIHMELVEYGGQINLVPSPSEKSVSREYTIPGHRLK